MASLITILIVVVAFMVYIIYKYCKANDLFKKVKWCVSSNSFDGTAENKMLRHILALQQEMSIDTKYKIASDESDTIISILRNFQQDLIRRYFDGVQLNSFKLTEEPYFVITLNCFLEKHKCEKDFDGNKMFTSKSHKSYENGSFSATYVLTDYAVTYYKLLYITQLYYNKLLKITDPNKLGVAMVIATKKSIDTREIDVNNF